MAWLTSVSGGSSLISRQRLAIDSNPTGTSWSSEHYDTADFGGLKDGVGLAIEASDTVTARSMEIRSPTAGYDAEIAHREAHLHRTRVPAGVRGEPGLDVVVQLVAQQVLRRLSGAEKPKPKVQ